MGREPEIQGHLPDGKVVPVVCVLEEKLDQQGMAEAGVLQSFGDGRLRIDKAVQHLRRHQFEVQEMLSQKSPVFLLTI